MFLKYIFIPHLEDTYLDLGPDIMSLCTREFVLNVYTNSTQVTYTQTSGEPIVINVSDPFNPIINIEQVRGRFTLVAYGDDETTDTLNILSGPIDNTIPITQTTKVGLPPVSVSIVKIYTQRINEFFRWRNTGGLIKWGNVDFLPNNVTSIKSYRLDNNIIINNESISSNVLINSNVVFGLEVKYNIGGNIFSRSGGNWFFDNNAQVDERWPLGIKLNTKGNTERLIFFKTLKVYEDELNPIKLNTKGDVSRIVYKVSVLNYSDVLNNIHLTTKGNTNRTVYIDRIIA